MLLYRLINKDNNPYIEVFDIIEYCDFTYTLRPILCSRYPFGTTRITLFCLSTPEELKNKLDCTTFGYEIYTSLNEELILKKLKEL